MKVRFEPRFNLSYQFIDDLFLEVLGEQKSQVTSQSIDLQTDFLGVENRRWVLSNPENRPVIESQQISAGLNLSNPIGLSMSIFITKKSMVLPHKVKVFKINLNLLKPMEVMTSKV